MSKKVQTSIQVGHVVPGVVFLTRLLLHSFVLLMMALFPCATPGLGLLVVPEFEIPVDHEESSSADAVSVRSRSRSRVGPGRPQSPSFIVVNGSVSLETANRGNVSHSGHRISNNLLAPQRC